MKYRIVLMVEGAMVDALDGTGVTSEAELVEFCRGRGFERTGTLRDSVGRSELQGQPIFAGLAGPMWDGGGVRYEDYRVNEILSM